MMNRAALVAIAILLFAGPAVWAADQPPQIPVPPIRTELGRMPDVDELPSRVELPDPLVMNDGRRVTTTDQWERRREEMKRILSYYAVGLMPPGPGNVKGYELKSSPLLDGQVTYRLVHLSFGPDEKLGFDIAIFVPAGRSGPFPTVIFPSFDATPGAIPLATMPRRPEQGHGKDALRLPLGVPDPQGAQAPSAVADPAQAAQTYQELFRRGYALVTYYYEDCGEDTIARNLDATWAFRNTRFFPAYPGYDWGLLGAWAWGISRCIDYLEGQDFADKGAFIVTGHSRIGKAVLVAGAFDERIAVSAPVGSAGGGVGAYRFAGKQRGGGEGLDDMMRKYPNWFSPHLHAFANDPERLPFDQHWFIALTAPRRFITLEGVTDHICSPSAVRHSLLGARPVYALFGRTDRLAVNYCAHGHALNDCDWDALLDFADWQLRGIKTERHFDEFPPESEPTRAAKTFDVRRMGAVGDGRTKDTAAFQQAIDQCSASGGGQVVVAAGDYLIGAIALKSDTILRLEQGAMLIGSPDINDYPLARIRWEGRWEQGHCALIHANDANHIAIVGSGHIIGDKTIGRRRNPRAPALVEPINCTDVRLEGFFASYANMWTIHPTRCTNVVVSGLTLRSTGGNGDGIDIDSCKNVRIERCDIDTGDDAIAIKSGRGMEGFRAAEPSEDIFIAYCVLGDSNFACIGIGSEMSGGVRDVRIEHCTFSHAKTNAIYIKSRPGRGGAIENISAHDLNVLSADGGFLRINLLKSGKQDPEPVPGDEGVPLGRNFRFSDIHLANCGAIVEATLISPIKPLQGLFLDNVGGECRTGMTLANIEDVHLGRIDVAGFEGPLLKTKNVTGAGLKGAVPLE
jgi:hypothetical protein